jgi:hypothetical protein
MGTIQSSLNQLFLSSLGAVSGVAYGLKGGFLKPKAPETEKVEKPKAETTSGMGNIAKIGKDRSRTGSRSYMAAAKAVDSGNDLIAQKARAKFIPIEDRLAMIKEASSLSVIQDKKGGSK